jgi:exopolysaccharide biosynthesis polyprenyl glycosylphosphotransferase
MWMVLDAFTVVAAAAVAILYRLDINLLDASRRFWRGTLIAGGGSVSMQIALLGCLIAALILTSRRLQLYNPAHLKGFLHEQRLSMQACLTSGLLLMGTMYLLHVGYISRALVLLTLILFTVALSVRRLIYRTLLYRRYERGMDTRNVLIVGTGPEAHALRHHLERMRHLGYSFKGFIDFSAWKTAVAGSIDVVGNAGTLFQQVRRLFVDEIFFTTPCEPGVMHDVLEQARSIGVDLRVVPDMYDGLAWNNPIEYIGQFPTIPLHCSQIHEVGLVIKRSFDILFSLGVLILISPALLAIAIAIKFDSPGPVFYKSERIGKKGRVFRCLKFRTMVQDAENRRAEVLHMNERDGVLFKVSNDPRITSLGRFLRKYSLDELPQFLNVLHGDMSIVGPRPPIASEVKEYKLSHLRRLNVTPGITGLWQVQGRKDPSFDSYVSLDMTYIDNWSIWLDLNIILRTIGVVLSGTGS